MLQINASKFLLQIADGLATAGFAEIADFLTLEQVSSLTTCLDSRLASQRFRPAGVSRGVDHMILPGVRDDQISWLERDSLTSAERELCLFFDQLREVLNRELQLGLWDTEAHFAMYPPGGRYQRHLDRFRDDNARVVSLVLYLNKNWQPTDGGELVIYGPEAAPNASPIHSIQPRAGTLVCFLSDQIEHEVLASHGRQRLSIAAWMRRRPRNLE